MTGRLALGALGVLVMVAAVPLQLHRTTLDPMPVWAAPLLLALTWGCLLGGASLIVWSRTRGRSQDQDDRPAEP